MRSPSLDALTKHAQPIVRLAVTMDEQSGGDSDVKHFRCHPAEKNDSLVNDILFGDK